MDFKEGLNAVVGTNGAGKSTLLEAICLACAAPSSAFKGDLKALLRNPAMGQVRASPKTQQNTLHLL